MLFFKKKKKKKTHQTHKTHLPLSKYMWVNTIQHPLEKNLWSHSYLSRDMKCGIL